MKLQSRKILVIGGTGFIGGFATEALRSLGAEVAWFGRTPPRIKREGVPFFQGDMANANALTPIIERESIDTIVHLAGVHTTLVQAYPELVFTTNIAGMGNVLKAAQMNKLKVVFASTAAIYGRALPRKPSGVTEEGDVNPVTVYAAGKLLCEKMGQAYVKNYGVKFIALRISAVYGFSDIARRGAEYPTFSDEARKLIELPLAGLPVVVERGGREPHDFVYVKDVAEAIAESCEADNLKHDIFNIGSGEVRTLTDFADIVRKYKPDANVTVREEPNTAYPNQSPLDISLAIKELNYKPKPFSECINDYIELTKARQSS
jgi:UDP-glucose 4-epimerase/UDP-glucuronate 4-epimerase